MRVTPDWTIMGVVNATPDSFSDGGLFDDVEAAARHAAELAEDGADIIDIGGESTRPGAAPVAEDEERERVIPVIRRARHILGDDAVLSIDTMKPRVAAAAVEAGATIWNDVTALRHHADSARIAADLGVDIVLMHMGGDPAVMQDAPHYDDVVGEVRDFLSRRVDMALDAGVKAERITLDPGIGFGKTLDHNLALIRGLGSLRDLGFPLLFGPSRKRFIGALSGESDAVKRDPGTVAACLCAYARGARAFRVHAPGPLAQALAVFAGVEGSSIPPGRAKTAGNAAA